MNILHLKVKVSQKRLSKHGFPLIFSVVFWQRWSADVMYPNPGQYCPNCQIYYASKSQLAEHLRTVHGLPVRNPPPVTNQNILPVPPKTPPTLKCEVCYQMIAGGGNLKRHMLAKHNIKSPEADEPKNILCKGCGKGFSKPFNLRRHHTSKRYCSLCPSTFECQEGMKKHNNEKHLFMDSKPSVPTVSSYNIKELIEDKKPNRKLIIEKSPHDQIMDAFRDVESVMYNIKQIINS